MAAHHPSRCNHSPSCPTLLFCSCKSGWSCEKDALAALKEDKEKGMLDANAEGVQKGAGTNTRSPLLWSAERNWARLATVLLDEGADVDKATSSETTALYISCYRGHVGIARLLLERGADVNKARTNDGATPLYISCQEGHVEIARLLLKGRC